MCRWIATDPQNAASLKRDGLFTNVKRKDLCLVFVQLFKQLFKDNWNRHYVYVYIQKIKELIWWRTGRSHMRCWLNCKTKKETSHAQATTKASYVNSLEIVNCFLIVYQWMLGGLCCTDMSGVKGDFWEHCRPWFCQSAVQGPFKAWNIQIDEGFYKKVMASLKSTKWQHSHYVANKEATSSPEHLYRYQVLRYLC